MRCAALIDLYSDLRKESKTNVDKDPESLLSTESIEFKLSNRQRISLELCIATSNYIQAPLYPAAYFARLLYIVNQKTRKKKSLASCVFKSHANADRQRTGVDSEPELKCSWTDLGLETRHHDSCTAELPFPTTLSLNCVCLDISN